MVDQERSSRGTYGFFPKEQHQPLVLIHMDHMDIVPIICVLSQKSINLVTVQKGGDTASLKAPRHVQQPPSWISHWFFFSDSNLRLDLCWSRPPGIPRHARSFPQGAGCHTKTEQNSRRRPDEYSCCCSRCVHVIFGQSFVIICFLMWHLVENDFLSISLKLRAWVVVLFGWGIWTCGWAPQVPVVPFVEADSSSFIRRSTWWPGWTCGMSPEFLNYMNLTAKRLNIIRL